MLTRFTSIFVYIIKCSIGKKENNNWKIRFFTIYLFLNTWALAEKYNLKNVFHGGGWGGGGEAVQGGKKLLVSPSFSV